MIRVDITNLLTNQIGWGGQFADQASVDAWIAQGVANNWWGLGDRWVALPDGDPQIASATETRAVTDVPAVTDESGNVVTPAITHTEYHLPAQYSVSQTDITAQWTLDQATQAALQNQNKGATVIARVAAINESKLAAATMSQQTFSALLQDTNVLNIERLLWNGSLVTAKALIQSTDLSAYYTPAEIASILAMF